MNITCLHNVASQEFAFFINLLFDFVQQHNTIILWGKNVIMEILKLDEIILMYSLARLSLPQLRSFYTLDYLARNNPARFFFHLNSKVSIIVFFLCNSRAHTGPDVDNSGLTSTKKMLLSKHTTSVSTNEILLNFLFFERYIKCLKLQT